MITETPIDKKEVTLKEYYDVAMALQNAIKGVCPPSYVNLSTTQLLKMVPILLFNFIAWILGLLRLFKNVISETRRFPHDESPIYLPRHVAHVQRCWVTGICPVLYICEKYNFTLLR
jgi:hypothetical protein